MDEESFGQWLQRQLTRREWTQADFARKTGISPSRINDWIRGIQRPSSKSCEKIADALGVDQDDVLNRAGHRLDPIDDPETKALFALIRTARLTAEQRSFVRSLVTDMGKFNRGEEPK